jgi:hypothetical protein
MARCNLSNKSQQTFLPSSEGLNELSAVRYRHDLHPMDDHQAHKGKVQSFVAVHGAASHHVMHEQLIHRPNTNAIQLRTPVLLFSRGGYTTISLLPPFLSTCKFIFKLASDRVKRNRDSIYFQCTHLQIFQHNWKTTTV